MRLNGWYPLLRARALGRRPVRAVVNGDALVVWRSGVSQIAALADRCPHRGAPLSAGKVEGGEIACPYHGWQFDGGGVCRLMPGLAGAPVKAHAQHYEAREHDGLIFARFGTCKDDPDDTPLMPGAHAVRLVVDTVPAGLADLAENILDTTHTSVVHARYLRRDGRRRLVQPVVRTGADWIEAHYPSEASPNGFVARLIGTGGYEVTDRFRAPAIAEVDYSRSGELVFRSRFHLVPESEQTTRVFAQLAVRGRGVLAGLKAWAVERMLGRIVAQDREILARVSDNRVDNAAPAAVFIAPQDIVRRGIDAILAGERPQPIPDPPQLMV